MSYTIYIGEAVIEDNTCEGEDEYRAEWTVNQISNKDAPEFTGDDYTGQSNGRHPGYSQWGDFCRRNRLYEIFFSKEEGIMREHPGCFKLTKKHQKVFEKAFDDLEKRDKRPAGLDERHIKDEFITIPEGTETHSYDKVRLIWLIWWTKWAINNCKKPAIYNS